MNVSCMCSAATVLAVAAVLVTVKNRRIKQDSFNLASLALGRGIHARGVSNGPCHHLADVACAGPGRLLLECLGAGLEGGIPVKGRMRLS